MPELGNKTCQIPAKTMHRQRGWPAKAEKNKHRGLGNYMEAKLRALENIAAPGMRATLQVTVVNGLNNDGVGELVRAELVEIGSRIEPE